MHTPVELELLLCLVQKRRKTVAAGIVDGHGERSQFTTGWDETLHVVRVGDVA